jgi:hypothetical protein
MVCSLAFVTIYLRNNAFLKTAEGTYPSVAVAQSGAIVEDIITDFELASTRLLRICPICNWFQDRPYDLTKE